MFLRITVFFAIQANDIKVLEVTLWKSSRTYITKVIQSYCKPAGCAVSVHRAPNHSLCYMSVNLKNDCKTIILEGRIATLCCFNVKCQMYDIAIFFQPPVYFSRDELSVTVYGYIYKVQMIF